MATDQTAEEQEASKRKRVFKKFQFRGVDLDKLVRTTGRRTATREPALRAGGRASERAGGQAALLCLGRASCGRRPPRATTTSLRA